MWTVTQLARRCGLSRTTILYYESAGLLMPTRRIAANRYRVYDQSCVERLRQIRSWRDAGLTLEDIRGLLERGSSSGASDLLERRLAALSNEIDQLRDRQRALARLLAVTHSLERSQTMNKEQWIEIMKKAGFSDEAMNRWHSEFERAAPADHQKFLEFLSVPADEIEKIRAMSKALPPK